jgi:acyl-CoA reductase-like NAD-dependent aldehyde dehydrogenase
VWVAEDAVGSDDPLHAAVTQRYLASRAARFTSVEACLAALKVGAAAIPCATDESTSVSCATAAKDALRVWRKTSLDSRCQVLRRLAGLLDVNRETLSQAMAVEIGKPVTLARAELTRSIALLHAAMHHGATPLDEHCTTDSVKRRVPLGVIAMVTPWNNPVAIPIGKIAPALVYGNTLVWKPSPAGSTIAIKLMELLREAGCPPGVVNLVCGDRATALALMSDPRVDAVTITGSPSAGYSAQDICARRHIPLQAELGGNNAAIVWSDCDLPRAAAEVADAAFAFAGQRCTANRRVVVDTAVYDKFLALLEVAVAVLPWGDPLDAATRVGPLISADKRRDVAALLERTRPFVTRILTPHQSERGGAYVPPTIVCCDDPAQEIVQEETFGPVLVVQRADDFDHALRLCNGVRQGLVASLFSASPKLRQQFLDGAHAGILKINMATADANVEAPFGGWKASGIGPPEHGNSNLEFYTRTQSVYRRT